MRNEKGIKGSDGVERGKTHSRVQQVWQQTENQTNHERREDELVKMTAANVRRKISIQAGGHKEKFRSIMRSKKNRLSVEVDRGKGCRRSGRGPDMG